MCVTTTTSLSGNLLGFVVDDSLFEIWQKMCLDFLKKRLLASAGIRFGYLALDFCVQKETMKE